MAHRRGAVPRLDIADRQLAGTHAVEEIPHVVIAEIEPGGILGQRGLEQRGIARLDLLPVDPDPAVGALEANAVALAGGIDGGAENTVVLRRLDVEGDAVLVGVLDGIIGKRGVAARDGLGQDLGLDLVGRDQPDGPVGDVVVVGAPVGHGAAGILIPVAEERMAALRDILDRRRLALPEIPVQAGGHGRRAERPLAEAGRQPDIGRLELADAAVADELARQPEHLRAALLGAGLQDDAVVAHRLDDVAALADRQRERFFAVDVLVRAGARIIHQGVPVIGRGVDDHMDIRVRQRLAVIRVDLGRGLALGGKLLGRGRGVGLVHIADGHNLAEIAGVARIAPAHAAAADEQDARAVVGGRQFFLLLGGQHLALGEPQRQAGHGRGQRGPLEESAARDVELLGSGRGVVFRGGRFHEG